MLLYDVAAAFDEASVPFAVAGGYAVALHGAVRGTVDVDIVLRHDLAKLKVKKVRSGGRTLPVVAVEDLIGMKRASGRPQDLEDVRALERLRK